jgi:putative redox protein
VDTDNVEVKMSKVEFEGAHGDTLAARLELPDGEIRACVLFAHCFTCSKNVFATTRVSRELARRGLAVLRFDFTGLGESEGDFADTNFSSNVADLVAAADYMREELDAPSILIGHSLGGSAVLCAAHEIPEVRAVCTIAAPFDPAHVKNLLGEVADDIESGETREVTIGGRTFTIRPQFLQDISNQDAEQYIGKLEKPLLIFHGPRDQVVGIENAELIFKAAKHPKSFVSLDDADHLLSDTEDSTFVAGMLSAWADRYVDVDERVGEQEEHAERVVRVEEAGTGKFTQNIRFGRHYLMADEPTDFGGDDRGGSPYELLLSALGACTSMTLRLYAERKGWDVGRISVELEHAKIHAKDCQACAEDRTGKIDHIERRVAVTGDITDEQRDKLLVIADKCPVHRTLEGRPHVETTWSSA